MRVGTWDAVATTWAVRGVRRAESHTTRTGFLLLGRRQVSKGSSDSTVPTPTMIPVYRWRWRCTWSRAVGPVIQRAAPVQAAILPSRVMAYFITT